VREAAYRLSRLLDQPPLQSAFFAALDLRDACFVGCCTLVPEACFEGARAFLDGSRSGFEPACCRLAFISRLARIASSLALFCCSWIALAATRNTPRSRANMKKHAPKIQANVNHSHKVVGRGCPSGMLAWPGGVCKATG
jgi:hypothetical protein